MNSGQGYCLDLIEMYRYQYRLSVLDRYTNSLAQHLRDPPGIALGIFDPAGSTIFFVFNGHNDGGAFVDCFLKAGVGIVHMDIQAGILYAPIIVALAHHDGRTANLDFSMGDAAVFVAVTGKLCGAKNILRKINKSCYIPENQVGHDGLISFW